MIEIIELRIGQTFLEMKDNTHNDIVSYSLSFRINEIIIPVERDLKVFPSGFTTIFSILLPIKASRVLFKSKL